MRTSATGRVTALASESDDQGRSGHMGLDAVAQAEQDAEEAGGQSAQQNRRPCGVPVHRKRQDQADGDRGCTTFFKSVPLDTLESQFDPLRREDDSGQEKRDAARRLADQLK